jgi:biopolymer transport protein ExbD
MRLVRPSPPRPRESTITLINIVFLMLIFFLIAGTVAPPLDPEVSLISTADADATEPPDALFATGDGGLRARGEPVTAADFVARMIAADGEAPRIRLAADRDLPAETLIDIIGDLRAAGAGTVAVVTERVEFAETGE